MQMYVVDVYPEDAAKMLGDQHVAKCTRWMAQILANVAYDRYESWSARVVENRLEGGQWDNPVPQFPYVSSCSFIHRNHPLVLWVGANAANWIWAVDHALALAEEFEYRFARVHKSKLVIDWCRRFGRNPTNDSWAPRGAAGPFLQIMPKKYRATHTVHAYRNYYINEKAGFLHWTRRQPPRWFPRVAVVA